MKNNKDEILKKIEILTNIYNIVTENLTLTIWRNPTKKDILILKKMTNEIINTSNNAEILIEIFDHYEKNNEDSCNFYKSQLLKPKQKIYFILYNFDCLFLIIDFYKNLLSQ